jgi:hypothetical protein
MGCEPAAVMPPARARRAIRLLLPDRNPLRRTVDKVEAAILAALALVFLAAAPLAVILTGHIASSDAARRAFAERIAWHQVPAVLLSKAVDLGYSSQPEAPARWIAPGGVRHTEMVDAPPGARAGRTVMVWTNAAGEQTGPPLTPAQVQGYAAVSAVLAPLVLGTMLLGAGVLARFLLARRRLSAWDAEWQATGPQWTRQL